MILSYIMDTVHDSIFSLPIIMILNFTSIFGSGEGTKQQQCCHRDLVLVCQYVLVILGLILVPTKVFAFNLSHY